MATRKWLEVIPNVRWGDERTFELACLGGESGKTIEVVTTPGELVELVEEYRG